MSTNGTAVTQEVRMLTFHNPATGEDFGEMPMSTPAEVQEARETLRQTAVTWAAKPLRERIRIVKKFQKVVIDAVDEITATINQDCGKTRQDGLIEVFIAVDVIHQYCKYAHRWLRPERVPPGLYIFKRFYTEQRPFGTVAILGPWNYPFLLNVNPMIAALIAGNTVMLKPSEVTGASGLMIDQLVRRVPELVPYVRVLHGDGQVGAAMVDAQPDLVFLTGSTTTGFKVAEATARTMTPFLSELGGSDPMIVLEDADLKAAARWGTWGAFYNAGQTCQAVERVYVVEPVYDAFVREVLAATEQIRVGYTPEIDSPFDLGPLTFDRQVRIIDDHLQDALAKGAVILTGGQRREMFMEPTVLVNVDHSMKIMREETFAPIMPIMKVKDEAEALRLANDSIFGLSASVWSQDLARARQVARQIEAGTILVNDVISQYAASQLPKGGRKMSGSARVHGREDLRQFTQTISYSVSRPPLPVDIATLMRQPGHYRLGKGIMQLAFGVTPAQRLAPVAEVIEEVVTTVKPADNGRRPPIGRAAAGVGAVLGVTAVLLGLLRTRR